MKVGLVMEGGSMRGMYTAGVTDVFMENGIQFDGGVGTSAGAVFGCNYKSGQIGRVIRYNKRFCGDRRYAGLWNWLTTGNVFGVDFCYKRIPEELDKFDGEAYKKSPMEFYVTCTDVETGKAVYKKCETGKGDELEWMRASASMPVVSTIVEIEGKKLLDGGIADSISLKFMEETGYQYNVVILTRPDGYIKEENTILPIVKLRYRKYPEFVRAVADRHIRYNNCISYIKDREEKGYAFVIRPSKAIDVKTVENSPQRLQNAYDLGRADGEKCVQEVKSFIENARNS
ncbi:MAG: patatin family protein [Ruminococcaceae bacterium]|nr:patatin family protein [Oscillospiraceae bacterium]